MLSLLRKVECFADLQDDALELVAALVTPVDFERGTFVCREGEQGDRMFIVESGEISVLKAVDGDDPVEVAVLRRGDIAGEMGLFGDCRRTASLRTRTACKAWSLDYDEFALLVEANGTVARHLLTYLAGHLANASSTMARLMARSMERGLRVAFFHAVPSRNRQYLAHNEHNYLMQFFEPRLSLDTVALAMGFRVVVVSANDRVDRPVVDELASLGVEMIALRCAGFNNVDLEACEEHDISVARVPAYSPYAVAEHSIALMMGLNRCIHRANHRVREGNFSLEGLQGFDMHGKTVGVIGTGKIGECALNILNGFGCRLLAHDLHPKQSLVDTLGVTYVEVDDLLQESDIVSLHAPLTESTHHLIDAAAIAKMKRGVMLINTSRGGLVETTALVEGLKTGQVGYAGLDVYEEEADYFFEDHSSDVIRDDLLARLTTFNNVMITSHMGSLTRDAQEAIVRTTIANIREFEEGMRGAELSNSIARAR